MADRYLTRTPLGRWRLIENRTQVFVGTKAEALAELLDRNDLDCHYGSCGHRACVDFVTEQSRAEIEAELRNERALYGDF